MAGNPDPGAGQGNPDPQGQGAGAAAAAGAGAGQGAGQESFAWKGHLGNDLGNAPSIKKFADTKEGLIEAATSYVNLEKLLGNEKIPVPKGPEDSAAWDLFKRAFQVPDKPEGYGLADPEVPASMKGMAFDKTAFSAAVHKFNLPPAAAKGLWGAYTEMVKASYAKAVEAHNTKLAETINALRSEWGDGYDGKIKLGEMVINKFSDDQEMNDFLTATLVKDPRGVKFLAKLGAQFAENKIGDFKYQQHSLTPDEAEKELAAIRSNANHPYNSDKFSQKERDAAIAYVNSLIAATRRGK